MFKRSTETLAEIIGSGTNEAVPRNEDLFSLSTRHEPGRHKVFRLEQPDALALPNVIIPAGGDLEDFFAIVATYYQDITPLSSVTHVLSDETSCLFTGEAKPVGRCSPSSSADFRIACLGAAVGEATLAGLGVNNMGGGLSYAACRRTLAFSLCRATVLYDTAFEGRTLAARWTRLRNLTGLSASSTVTDAVLHAHMFAAGHTTESSRIELPLREALKASATGPMGDGRLVSVLITLYPAMDRYLESLRGPFDGRMSAFTRLVESVRTSTRGQYSDDIAVAFACNRILPGSFAHSTVLARLVEFFPSALVWYGYFAALSNPSDSQHLGTSLISKLGRDLDEEFSFKQRPRCDISLEELEILTRISLSADLIKPSQPRAVLVALLPGVDIYTRFGTEVDSGGDRVRRELEGEELHSRVSKLLEEALHALSKYGDRNADISRASVSRRSRKGR